MKQLLAPIVVGLLSLPFLGGCGAGPQPPIDSTGKPRDPAATTGGDPTRKPGTPSPTTAQPPAAGVVASPEDLVAGLPANAHPKDVGDTIRCDRANDWLKANATGKRIAWDYALGEVSLQRIGETHDYTVTLYHQYAGEKKRDNHHTLHGLNWDVRINEGSIVLGPIDDETADRMAGLKNKVVKLQATVDSANLVGGCLAVGARNFILDGIKTGLWRDLDLLKSRDAAVRKQAVLGVMREGYGADATAALAALGGVAKDDDREVRETAAVARLVLDPGAKIPEGLSPDKASVNGKYSGLLRVLYLPQEKDSYGEFNDNGAVGRSRAYDEYMGYRNIPEGYWVYVYPLWFIWERQK